MRTIWNGSISFGLVSIPIGLALATKPAARSSDVSSSTLHRECGTPIKQKRWCPVHDREVPNDEIVKGWEVAKGQFVIVEDADLEAIMRHDESRSIDITRFVPADDVDPVWFDRTYFLVPASALRPAAAARPAARGDARDGGTAALGRFIIRGTENLCLIRPKDALVLETMFVGEIVYRQAEIDEAVGDTEVKEPELALARQVIDSLVGEFEPSELVSEYRRDARDARGQAGRRGDLGPRARARSARRRPHGGAAQERGRDQRPRGGPGQEEKPRRGRARKPPPARGLM